MCCPSAVTFIETNESDLKGAAASTIAPPRLLARLPSLSLHSWLLARLPSRSLHSSMLHLLARLPSLSRHSSMLLLLARLPSLSLLHSSSSSRDTSRSPANPRDPNTVLRCVLFTLAMVASLPCSPVLNEAVSLSPSP